MFKIAILGSGRGSNAEAILKAEKEGLLGNTESCCIISDNEGARILELGKTFDVPSYFIDPGPFKTKMTEECENAYVEKIRECGADLVVLAGFMRVIKEPMLKAFDGRIINLHPSLLPKHPGLNSIKRAFDAGDSETGCTVHWVNAEIDGGAIIGQSTVSIDKEDTLDSLEEKVHAAEHMLLPSIIKELSEKQ